MKEHIQAASDSPFAAAAPQVEMLEEIAEEPPSLPDAVKFAWSYFLRLNRTRQSGGLGGFSAISHQEMLAYFALEQVVPDPWEVEMIRQWDDIALRHFSEEAERQTKTSKK